MTEAQKSILVTGAASGIGRAAAELFAGKGWLVGCFDVNAAGLEALEQSLPGASLVTGTLDVSNRDAVETAMARFAEASGGRLDLLFSNAGIDAKGSFIEMDWDRVMAVLNVNLIGHMLMVRAAHPLLKAADNALCLATASGSAIFGTANLAVYSASKHGVKGLTEALAVEFAADGIRVADILPGIVDTGMLPAEVKAMLPATGPWRPVPAEAVAELVWQAYQANRLHWYIPEELAELDVQVTAHPEAVRDDRIANPVM